jgi:hypothetical protein
LASLRAALWAVLAVHLSQFCGKVEQGATLTCYTLFAIAQPQTVAVRLYCEGTASFTRVLATLVGGT